MSAAGPSRMYAQQAVAYSARDSMAGRQTDSTEDSPPTHTAPDLEGLCELKKKIIANPPTHCCHCNAEFTENSIVEIRDECIMAYCKKKGACGKSLVLFAGLNLTYPVYAKICPFKSLVVAASEPVVLTLPVESEAGPPITGELSQQEQVEPAIATSVFALPAQALPPGRWQEVIDVYALHNIHRPEEMCALCGKQYREHDTRPCDQNGWVETHSVQYTLPRDWPVYNSSTHSWHSIE